MATSPAEEETDQSDTAHMTGGYERDLLVALRSELQEERARKTSLENRSLAIATAAGAATTLLLGLGNAYKGRWQAAFFSMLLVGALCFLAGAVTGWLNSLLREYQEIDTKAFDQVLESGWEGTREEFALYMAEGALAALVDARQKNDRKARMFTTSLFLVVLGAGIVSVELVIFLLDRILQRGI